MCLVNKDNKSKEQTNDSYKETESKQGVPFTKLPTIKNYNNNSFKGD